MTTLSSVQQTIIEQVQAQFVNRLAYAEMGFQILVSDENTVQFNSRLLKRNIQITYNYGSDAYDVRTAQFNRRGILTNNSLNKDVYCDELVNFFDNDLYAK